MNEQTRSMLIWGGFIVVVVGLLVLLATMGSDSQETQGAQQSTVTADEHIKGNPDAELTLVEYSDFECPFCATAYPHVDRLAQEYSNDLRVVYRHFPLRQTHDNAQLAAQAAEAADEQGKFWEMHDVIFNTQSEWANGNAEEIFIDLAESLGLNMQQFESDMRSNAAKSAVDADYREGIQDNVQGTPTFFLNGQRIQTPSTYAGFKQTIEQALEQNQ